MIDITQLFAKTIPFVSLYDHCINTGNAAGLLWDLGVIKRSIIERNHLCLLASLHDLGKCHPFFQSIGINIVSYADQLMHDGFLPYVTKKYRHELGSEKILLKKIEQFKDKKTAKALAKILRLHHQKSEEYSLPYPRQADWICAQDALIVKLENYFNVKLNEISFEVCDSVCTMLWGVVILADWLESGGLSEKIVNIFEKKSISPKSTAEMFGISKLRPLQKQCEEIASHFDCANLPSAIILEAPMGEGKTEAALFLAAQLINKAGKNGFYLALPTMATARSMEIRVSKFLNENNIGAARLVHSESWLNEEVVSEDEIDKSWFAPTKRSLLSNFAVGTVDQAMKSVLRIKHGILSLLGLSSKVLIIDEIHAYDSYMQTIIFRLLEWCKVLEIPVIILSATLPSERKSALLESYGVVGAKFSDSYPLITTVYKDSTVKETVVESSYINKILNWECAYFTDYIDIAARALNALSSGGCCCVIMNTVKDAQNLYRECKEKASTDTRLMLFHARFLAKDRKIIENECLKAFGKDSENRPAKALLIATQVVEQSLDVDFDYMISAVAPIDLLLQRAGRLHRHDRKRPSGLEIPQFTVLLNNKTADSDISIVYDKWILSQTEKVIAEKDKVYIPNDIRELVENVYNAMPQSSNEDFKTWTENYTKVQIQQGEAKSKIFPSPYKDWFFPLESGDFFDEGDNELISADATTRLGGNNIKVAVLPKELWDEKMLADSTIGYARQIMDYCVSVRINEGSLLVPPDTLFECGGYLRGVYAVQSEGEFILTFSKFNKILKRKYRIDSEYGLKEEQ